ncbi:hypothetical protein VTN00DRAFT_8157, partial [Thermoascus crustaceus]|uniref:uncharacterized protein n=1 Tax=Thermoascus crustaceus TaxID=5088 RepID=UPI003744A19A
MQYAALAVAWLLALVRVVAGQISYNAETNSLMCSKPEGTYCDGVSLTTPILINCASANVAEVHSCDLVLAHILPDGFQEAALCYESSESAGDAVCAFNGTGYTLYGISYEIPESSIIALRDANESATPETDSTDACGIFAIPPETTDAVSTAVTSAGSSEYTGSQPVSSSSAKSSLSPSPSFTNVSLTDTVITTSLPYTVKSIPKAATTHIFTTEEGSVPALTTVWKTIVLFTETEAVESSTGVLHQKDNTTISPPETGSSSII